MPKWLSNDRVLDDFLMTERVLDKILTTVWWPIVWLVEVTVKKWDLELVQAFARPLKRRILDRELIGKTFSIECPYLFGLLAALLRRLPVLGELCPLTYVDHVSKVVLEIFDELVQTGGLVKAPNKQSSFLCDNQRNRRWGKQKSGTTNVNPLYSKLL